MAKSEPNLIDRINEAQQRITDVFLRQCTYGAQTKRLPQEFAGCGQFVAGDAEAIEQYGLHGISAALRVLGPWQSDECRSIVHRLVSYCEASFGIRSGSQLRAELDVRDADKQNVIKLGELLYGLSFVTTGQAERDRLIQHIAKKLKESVIDDKGLGYFIGDKEPEFLPTAFAVRGLAQNGYDISGPRKFLLDSLNARNQSASDLPADLTSAVACTYCLTFSPIVASTQDHSILKATFLSAWSSLEPLLSEDIEQNLEYWHGDKTEYVRIPFQLYLLALASEYSQWRFAGFRAQRRLNTVIDQLRSGSFRYPYSGKYLSSRTNSVAYDALAATRDRIRHLIWLRFANVTDSIRVFIGSRVVRRIAGCLALLVIFYSVRQWLRTGNIADMAPELLASFIALVLASARR